MKAEAQDDARRLALVALINDPVRLVMAEWNTHLGRLMCEACHRTIESGHAADCPHHRWIQAVRDLLSALTSDAGKDEHRKWFGMGFSCGLAAVDKFGEQHETAEEAWAAYSALSPSIEPETSTPAQEERT